MQEAIKDTVRSIKQKLCNNADEAISYINDNLTYPVIVKPIDSAGTEGVTFCRDEKTVIKAFNLYLNKENVFGIINKQMLVQEFLNGLE